MGLFKKKNPQDAFDPDVFTITDTILDPPRFTLLPAIYQDATRRKWAVHHRGGGGMMLHNLTEKTGLVAGIAVVDSENDVMIITDDGVIIRTGVEEIRECGRGSQGVIVMRTGEDVKVISIARTDKEEEESAEAEEETSESAENAESTEE